MRKRSSSWTAASRPGKRFDIETVALPELGGSRRFIPPGSSEPEVAERGASAISAERFPDESE